MQNRRVVITGMGTVNPLGNDIDSYWNNLITGKSGIGLITRFDTTDYKTQIAGEVKNFDPTKYIPEKKARRTDIYTQYALYSSFEAINDSGLDLAKIDSDRAGVIIGTGIGGISTLYDQHNVLMTKGPSRISPFLIPMMIADIASGETAIQFGFKGPNFTTTSACASSAHAIGTSYELIKSGYADLMITGGSEAPLVPISLAGFCAARSLSQKNDTPKEASSPFDKNRDGFVMSEGAGIILLEELQHALQRSAHIYAEVCGTAFTADAYHLTAPHPEGDGAYKVMLNALNNSGITPEDLDYINCHGTSTVLGDIAEAKAINKLFEGKSCKVRTSSTKSMTGHLLGAAAAVETIATVKTLNTGIIHPTINYKTPDPECDIDVTPNIAVEKEVGYALLNSFGFGGHNASFVIKKATF
ncbi:beta-ketoacyl-ACP synthase II [bacterium]|nr:beta-ketoacyl-ACP synthase II [bacterium]